MPYVSSTAIRQIEWDKRTLNLFVTFTSDKTYTYYGVPEWKYVDLLAAASTGQYFNANIRDQHSSSRH